MGIFFKRKPKTAKGAIPSSSQEREQSDEPMASSAATQEGSTVKDGQSDNIEPIIIVGAGIVGLVLALALEKHCGIKVDVYEQAVAFQDDVGAGMGCYPNGLRVIEDISPDLLADIQDIGYPYLLRRYEVCSLIWGDSSKRYELLLTCP
jgi:ribulose 1,5-bisphosphate synthetase/thiazole synthase